MPIIVHVSDDFMEASVEIALQHDETIVLDAIMRALAHAGVTHGIDEDACIEIVATVNEAPGRRVTHVVARGTLPIGGEDGRVELAVQYQRNAVGLMRDSGSIDFHERGSFTPISKNELIAVIVLPTAGSPGKDVRGKEIRATAGKRAPLRPGQGTKLDAGGTELRATRPGDLKCADDAIEVLDIIRIAGNVDFAVGSIECEGPVRVEGDVLAGFHIRAGGDVWISGVVDAAEVTSSGSIIIGQGILRGSRVAARNGIKAGFAREAYVESDSTIAILTECFNSTVIAGDSILISRGGRVVGGRLLAQNRIEAGVAGNPRGLPTALIVGMNPLNELRAAKLSSIGRAESAPARTGHSKELAQPGQHQVLEEILKRTLAKKEDHAADLEEIRNNAAKLASCTIAVKEIYPGVRIRIGPAELELQEERQQTTFTYDAGSGQLVQV